MAMTTTGVPKRRSVLPSVVLAVGLMLTSVVTFTLWTNAREHTDDNRQALVDKAAAAVEFRMETYVQSLKGVTSLFEASEVVTAAEFRIYVESLGVLEDLPGMQGLGWNRLVSVEDVTAYEQRTREQQPLLPADFQVRPIDDTAAELLVVEFVQPLAGNEEALGFNILSEEHRAAAFTLSRSTDTAAATAPVALVQDDASVPGILVLLPTREGQSVNGAVVAVFRTADLLTAAADELSSAFVVQDIGAVEPNASRSSDASGQTLLSRPGTPIDTTAQVEIDVYGRRWLVSLADDGAGTASSLGLILGAGSGVALAAALAWLLHVNQRAAVTAQRKAKRLTKELVAANEEVLVTKSRLERGLRSASVLVWERNLSTGTAWSSAYGDHPDDTIERELRNGIHPEDRPRVEADPDPAPGQTSEIEYRSTDRNGVYHWILARSHGVDRRGQHVVIGANINIDEQHEHTELVERLNDDLTERNEALRDFTHVASHDLRSPLRAVSSLVSFLREDLPTELHGDVEHHLQRIDERVARMSQLIDDLLSYARAHRRESPVESFFVEGVVNEILATLDIPNEMTAVVDCDLPPLSLARTPFTTCVRNLVDNALKHHDRADGQIAITSHVADGMLHLAVSDDGPGIDPDYLPKIFEPFRRLRTDDATPGSGIGLSVIERSTAAHGGRIDVHSAVGEGSTFTIRWPIEPAIDCQLVS